MEGCTPEGPGIEGAVSKSSWWSTGQRDLHRGADWKLERMVRIWPDGPRILQAKAPA